MLIYSQEVVFGPDQKLKVGLRELLYCLNSLVEPEPLLHTMTLLYTPSPWKPTGEDYQMLCICVYGSDTSV